MAQKLSLAEKETLGKLRIYFQHLIMNHVRGISFETDTQHNAEGFMPLGAYSYSHSFAANIAEIGRYCSIGANLRIITNTHPLDHVSTSPVFYAPRKFREWGGLQMNPNAKFASFQTKDKPVHIENDVWIGDNVHIRAGVKIGNGAVLAAGAIVTKDVPPYAIVGGNPAKIIRMRFDDSVIESLLALAWWEYHVTDLINHRTDDPKRFIESFAKACQNDALAKRPHSRNTARGYLELSALATTREA